MRRFATLLRVKRPRFMTVGDGVRRLKPSRKQAGDALLNNLGILHAREARHRFAAGLEGLASPRGQVANVGFKSDANH